MWIRPSVVGGRPSSPGQRSFVDAAGLMDYGARFYDPALGRFVSADSIVPEPGNPQALNRYGYGYSSPLNYTDPDGHFPLPILIIGIVLLKIADYGWTAYDAYQASATLADPNASPEDKAFAAADLAMTAAFEAAEPDDALPISLPLDDLARYAAMGVMRESAEQAARSGSKSYVRRWEQAMGRKVLPEHELHHGFPQQFETEFRAAGIDINSPFHLYELPVELHRFTPNGVHTGLVAKQWNGKWKERLRGNPTKEDMYKILDELAEEWGISRYSYSVLMQGKQ